MAMHQYEVDIRGITHTFQIDEEDLDRYPGARRVRGSKAIQPTQPVADEQVGRSPVRSEPRDDGVDPSDTTDERDDETGQVITSPRTRGRRAR